MTRKCTLKEAFVERKLDEFQSGWRTGEDITAETKRKIREYVASKMPPEFIDEVICFTDYSIWHMAKKIRKRENLSEPQRSNRGNKGAKVSICEPRGNAEPSACDDSVMEAVKRVLDRFGFSAVIQAIERFQNETSSKPDGIPPSENSSGMKFKINLNAAP